MFGSGDNNGLSSKWLFGDKLVSLANFVSMVIKRKMWPCQVYEQVALEFC